MLTDAELQGIAAQRGRRWTLHESTTKPMTSRAVVLGSIVTFFSSGGCGTCTFAQSSITSRAFAGRARGPTRHAKASKRAIKFGSDLRPRIIVGPP